MRTVKLGWRVLPRHIKWFTIWVAAVGLIGIIYGIGTGNLSLISTASVAIIFWSTFITLSNYSRGIKEASFQATALSKSNGHHNRSVIVILDEKKKDNDKSSESE